MHIRHAGVSLAKGERQEGVTSLGPVEKLFHCVCPRATDKGELKHTARGGG